MGVGGMNVLIRIGDRETAVDPGQSFFFGRDAGPGQITLDDRSVSGRHGRIEALDDVWQISSLGSLYSFSVYDVETPSRLFVPIGAGPVRVPFANSIVAVEIRDRRHVLSVRASGAPKWADSWKSVRDMVHPLRGAADVANDPQMDARRSNTTVLVWQPEQFVDRRGNLRRWYQVLVAMCEPRLRLPAELREERVPSNKQIANRLDISDRTLEKHLDEMRRHFGFDRYTDQMRIAVVVIAIGQRLVTVDDLQILDEPMSPT